MYVCVLSAASARNVADMHVSYRSAMNTLLSVLHTDLQNPTNTLAVILTFFFTTVIADRQEAGRRAHNIVVCPSADRAVGQFKPYTEGIPQSVLPHTAGVPLSHGWAGKCRPLVSSIYLTFLLCTLITVSSL